MKTALTAAAVAACLAGCAPSAQQPPAQTAEAALNGAPARPAARLTAQQELGKFCRVCVVDKGEKIEEFFPSRLDTRRGGQTYKFCTEVCKKKFDAKPARYALK